MVDVNFQVAAIEEMAELMGVELKRLKKGFTIYGKNSYYLNEKGEVEGLRLSFSKFSDGISLPLILSSHFFKDLKYLGLNNIGMEKIDFLSQFKKLKELSLWGNNIKDIGALSLLYDLKRLDLDGNSVDDVSAFKGLKSLEHLNISNNILDDITPLKHLHKLQSLDISNTRVKDLSSLNGLKSLHNLEFANIKIIGRTGVAKLENLRSLNINNNKSLDISELDELSQLSVLSMRNNSLEGLSSIKNLKNLTELNISGNKLKSIEELKGMKELKRLDIGENKLNDFSILESLGKLEEVSLSYANISNISFLSELKCLKHLKLGFNTIKDIRPLQGLSKLLTLDLNGNAISQISSLEHLHELEELRIGGNNILDISPLGKMKTLKEVDLGANSLSEISPLQDLKNLLVINLFGNNITDISPLAKILKSNKSLEFNIFAEDFGYRKNTISLGGNPLQNPPLEIVEQGRKAVLSYFKNLKAGKININECKVLVIGDAENGKTTLIKRFLGEEIFEKQPKTDGIFIKHQKIKEVKVMPADRGGIKNESTIKSLQLNIWDFGGQEIYKKIHKLFLTKQSIYVLVLDARKDNDAHRELYNGLNLIKSYGGNKSPVIIVGNKIDQNTTFTFPSTQTIVEKGFNNPLFFCKLSAQYGNTWEKSNYSKEFDFSIFEEKVRGCLKIMENIAQEWPKSFMHIREKIEKITLSKEKNYISKKEFEEICKQEKWKGNFDILSEAFNNLGVFTHFENEEIGTLDDVYLTNPEWATNAVYDILDSKELKDGKGEIKFNEKRWHNIFKKNGHGDIYSQSDASYVKELIIKFNLGYVYRPKGCEECILIPSIFDNTQPQNDFDIFNQDNLHMRIIYKSYSGSILHDFIVKEHENLTDVRWKSGAIFDNGIVKAKVIGDEYERQIDIYVQGNDLGKRSYFNHLLEIFRTSHVKFGGNDISYNLGARVSEDKDKWVYIDYSEVLATDRGGQESIFRKEGEFKVSELLNRFGIKKESEQKGNTYITTNVENMNNYKDKAQHIENSGDNVKSQVSSGKNAKNTQNNSIYAYAHIVDNLIEVVEWLEEIQKKDGFSDLKFGERKKIQDATKEVEEAIVVLEDISKNDTEKKGIMKIVQNTLGNLANITTIIKDGGEVFQKIAIAAAILGNIN